MLTALSRLSSPALLLPMMSFLLFIPASDAGAQSSRVGAILEGTVSDSSGAVVPDAEVTLGNAETGQMRVARTDAQGFFRAAELPAGAYEIRVSHAGFAPYRNTGVEMPLGVTVHLRIVLTVASTSAEVTVSAETGAIDPAQTSVVSTVGKERIEELPVRSRDYLDFVLLAPGVSNAPHPLAGGGATGLAGSGFTFGGLRARSNNVSVDGLDNNDEYSGSVGSSYGDTIQPASQCRRGILFDKKPGIPRRLPFCARSETAAHAQHPVFGSALLPLAGFATPITGTGARQFQFSLDFEF